MFSGEEVFDPLSWISHPSYNPNTVDYDFALVELDTIITWSKYVQPICLPEPDVPVRQERIELIMFLAPSGGLVDTMSVSLSGIKH